MAGGPVNQALLESFYQNAGEVYDDVKTEGAFQVIANQVNDNWADYDAVKTTLNSVAPGTSGSEYVKSAPIAGVTGSTVYAQLSNIEAQVQALVVGSIPTASVTYDKLNPVPTAANNPNTLPVRNASNQIEVGTPTVAAHAATKAYVDAVNVYVDASIPVSGTYTGNGALTRDIALPFTPSAILVMPATSAGTGGSGYETQNGGLAVTGSPVIFGASVRLEVGANKFTVAHPVSATFSTNNNATVYNYTAFK